MPYVNRPALLLMKRYERCRVVSFLGVCNFAGGEEPDHPPLECRKPTCQGEVVFCLLSSRRVHGAFANMDGR